MPVLPPVQAPRARHSRLTVAFDFQTKTRMVQLPTLLTPVMLAQVLAYFCEARRPRRCDRSRSAGPAPAAADAAGAAGDAAVTAAPPVAGGTPSEAVGVPPWHPLGPCPSRTAVDDSGS